MELVLILLIVALGLYAAAAFAPRLRANIDMTAVGLALVCFTILVATGLLG